MTNDLVEPDQLNDFPGAPFAQSIVDAVVAAMRNEAGWHIAPIRTETILLDTDGGTTLFLPTLRLLDVTEIRDLTGAAPRVLDGWRPSRAGMVTGRWWPCGFGAVEADIRHGYEETPADLLLVIAERCQLASLNSGVRQETAGGESISYSASGSVTPEAARIWGRYQLPEGYR